MKALTEITLYDLMAEDLEVYVRLNKEFGIDLEIDDENSEPLVREEGINSFATDALADFCRSYLSSYEKAILRKTANQI